MPTSAPSPIPPDATPAPIPAALAGIHVREIIPAPMLPEIRPSASFLFPGFLLLGTMKVCLTA
ncbi:MAG TPA: hypothetical protein VGF59_01505 [Bryobacteraceae bacterium]|jgi:hypothetical protein